MHSEINQINKLLNLAIWQLTVDPEKDQMTKLLTVPFEHTTNVKICSPAVSFNFTIFLSTHRLHFPAMRTTKQEKNNPQRNDMVTSKTEDCPPCTTHIMDNVVSQSQRVGSAGIKIHHPCMGITKCYYKRIPKCAEKIKILCIFWSILVDADTE